MQHPAPEVPATETGTSTSKDKIKFLLLEGIHPSAVAVIQAAGYTQIESIAGALSGEALENKLRGVHFLGIRSRTQLTRPVLAHGDRLAAVGCFCIGTNQVDLAAARDLGIAVFNAPFSNTRSVAEMVLAEAILLMRGVPEKSAAAVGSSRQRAPSRCAARPWASWVTAPSARSARCWPRAWA